MKDTIKLPEEGFIRLKTVLEVLPVGRSTFYAGVKKGTYPKPVKLSERCSAWRVEDIRQLIEKLSNQD